MVAFKKFKEREKSKLTFIAKQTYLSQMS